MYRGENRGFFEGGYVLWGLWIRGTGMENLTELVKSSGYGNKSRAGLRSPGYGM